MATDLPPVPEQRQGELITTWLMRVHDWLAECRLIMCSIERPQQDPRVPVLEKQVTDLAAENEALRQQAQSRVCACCGHVDGVCPQCHMPHRPVVESGCEACVRADDVPPAVSSTEEPPEGMRPSPTT